jgi:hypothetical protein
MKATKQTEHLVAAFCAANKSSTHTSPEMDKRILADVLIASKRPTPSEPVPAGTNIRRIIMKSPLTTLAAAAVIIACAIGLLLWRTTGSGIALADVLTRIEQVTGYAYQLDSTTTEQQGASTRTSTVLVSKEDGIRMIVTQADTNSQPKYETGDEWYLLPSSNSVVIVSPKKKTYDRFVYDGIKLEFYKEQYNEPRAIIKQILSCKHESLGQSMIDGITVEGFQTTDVAYGGGFFGEAARVETFEQVDVKLWVDLSTFLPVRLQEDVVTEKGRHIHEVSYDFRWNVITNQNDFKPNIPADYRAPVGDIIIYDANEENAIKGLRLFVDAFGKYPMTLEKKGFGEEVKKLMPPDPNSYKELSDEERTKKTSESLSLAAPSFFYRLKLLKDNHDPAYYGKTVTPKDADKVLMRWKVSDNEYRVIFGDLHTETVSPERLTELEESLPR